MGKKALLVISFGTTYQETREKTILAIEQNFANKFEGYDVFRAFTSRKVIKKLKDRDNLIVNTPSEALEKILQENYEEVLCQSTHVINGFEYDKTLAEINEFSNKFSKFSFGKPLLSSHEDYISSAKAIIKHTTQLKNNEALFLMGHGTEHAANESYLILEDAFRELAHENIYVGTVEGHPEIDDLILTIKCKDISKIYLMPFMIVAGDHAQNDLAGEEPDSWKSILESEGYLVEVILTGLGEIAEIRDMFVKHLKQSQ